MAEFIIVYKKLLQAMHRQQIALNGLKDNNFDQKSCMSLDIFQKKRMIGLKKQIIRNSRHIKKLYQLIMIEKLKRN